MDFRLTIAVLLWVALAGVSLAPLLWRSWNRRMGWAAQMALFIGVLLAAFVAWRWRSLNYVGEINVDEGTTIAMAMKYLSDPVPWRSVDGVTCGPLSTWVALWAPAIGLDLNYLTLRMTAVGLIVVSLVGSAFFLREMVGRRLAFALTLLPATLLLTALNFDFVTFAMEHLPIALGVWSVYLLARIRRKTTPLNLFGLGVLTGAMPFTKLQAAPSAVFLFGVGVWLVWRAWKGMRQEGTARIRERGRFRALLFLGMGGVVVPASILIPVTVAGVWNEFVYFYLLCGSTYQANFQKIPILMYLLRGSAEFGAFFGTAMVGATVLLAGLFGSGMRGTHGSSEPKEWWVWGAVTGGYFGVVLYSVLRSGFYFPHYLLLMILPTLLVLAWAVRGHLLMGRVLGGVSGRLGMVRSVVLGALAIQGWVAFGEYQANPALLKPWGIEQNPLFEAIQKLTSPGDCMAIWGWNNKLHVRTGIRPATRFVGLTYVIDPAPQYNFHRKVFLEDLKASKAKLFIDAVDEFRWPSWPAGAAARHTMMPELAAYIRDNYQLAGELQTAPNRLPVQVYVRKSP